MSDDSIDSGASAYSSPCISPPLSMPYISPALSQPDSAPTELFSGGIAPIQLGPIAPVHFSPVKAIHLGPAQAIETGPATPIKFGARRMPVFVPTMRSPQAAPVSRQVTSTPVQSIAPQNTASTRTVVQSRVDLRV